MDKSVALNYIKTLAIRKSEKYEEYLEFEEHFHKAIAEAHEHGVVSPTELSEELNVSRKTINKWIDKGNELRYSGR